MAEANEMDLTAKLPDEVLMEIFDHLPSLHDKLRLESVNRRFQRCLLQLLNNRPLPLNVWEQNLNGYNVPLDQLPAITQMLAKKAKFCNIDIGCATSDDVNRILASLVDSNNDCLIKVNTVEITSENGCSEALLQKALARCPKLSEVQLHFRIRPWSNQDVVFSLFNPDFCEMELSKVLKEKALTQLHLNLEFYRQEQVVQMFQSLKPGVLRKIKLRLLNMILLDMDKLVTELRGGAWAALEEIEINFQKVDMQLDALFSPLTRLPAVRKCNFVVNDIVSDNQLLAALTSLFANQMKITVQFVHQRRMTGCQFVALIHQVQAVHPEIKVDFIISPDGDKLTLTLDKVSFQQDIERTLPSCADANCVQCGIFYPSLLCLLTAAADRRAHGGPPQLHLANGRLDRCRVNTVVSHLNQPRRVFYRLRWWKALQAEMNEAHNLVTIAIETAVVGGYVQFQMAVDCGRCLSNSCIGCADVG